MPNRIPIKAAQEVARGYNCRQVILLAWDGVLTHVVTYCVNQEECDQAAEGGNRIKRSLGWPESLCNAEPSRVKKLKDENSELRNKVNGLEHALAEYTKTREAEAAQRKVRLSDRKPIDEATRAKLPADWDSE
jgi:hypothetical protein